jgi:O-antigen/teichoic acid export membrane protein
VTTSPRERIRKLIARVGTQPVLQRVVRNSGYLLGAQTGAAALSMLQGILAARLLGVEGLGLLGVITQFASVINRLTSFRMGELVVSFVSEYQAQSRPREAAAVFKLSGLVEILSSLGAFALLGLLAPWAASQLAHEAALAGVIVLYGIVLLANLMAESSTGLLQVFNQFRLIAGVTLAQSLLTLLVIGVGFLLRTGLEGVLLGYLVGKGVSALALTALAFRRAAREWGADWWKSRLSLLAGRRRELIRFGLSTNLSATLSLITRDSEVLWLSAFSSPLQVGYYKVALAVTNILLVPVTPLISPTYREVAREIGGRRWGNVGYVLRSGSLMALAWTAPSALALAAVGPWIIGLYGAEFQPAYPMLLVLIAGAAVANLLYWNRAVLLSLGRAEVPTRVHFVAAAAKVGGILYWVPRFGGTAMAWLLSGYFALTSGALAWLSLREVRRAEGAAESIHAPAT